MSARDTAAEQLETILEIWARWMRSGGGPDGLPSRACVGEGYSTLDHDSDGANERLDKWLAIACGTVIAGLAPAQRCALHRQYLEAVYRFKDFEASLTRAKVNVAIGLRRRGVWLGDGS